MTTYFDPEGFEAATVASVPELDGARVLEIGVGDGRLTWQYAARARSVVGVDTDGEAVADLMDDRPPGLRSRVSALVGDSGYLPFAAERFDGAVLAWSL
jgi:16S rRNA A1518/A1519 N6-dimethyltransferase RsmA/KsgA/DIM1 with predicted DNA glycosylase/AP lyase activity